MEISNFTKIHFGLTPLSSPLDQFPDILLLQEEDLRLVQEEDLALKSQDPRSFPGSYPSI